MRDGRAAHTSWANGASRHLWVCRMYHLHTLRVQICRGDDVGYGEILGRVNNQCIMRPGRHKADRYVSEPGQMVHEIRDPKRTLEEPKW